MRSGIIIMIEKVLERIDDSQEEEEGESSHLDASENPSNNESK